MKTFAHHHVDTPHGDSHAPISTSILMTGLFLGAQGLIRIGVAVSTPIGSPTTAYSDGSPFALISSAIGVLLLAFLAVDLRRNRLEAHGRQRYQYMIFGVAALALLSFLWSLHALARLTGPLG